DSILFRSQFPCRNNDVILNEPVLGWPARDGYRFQVVRARAEIDDQRLGDVFCRKLDDLVACDRLCWRFWKGAGEFVAERFDGLSPFRRELEGHAWSHISLLA